MAPDVAVPAKDAERFDTTALRKRWGRHPVTITRYINQGFLAEPTYFMGRRMWTVEQVREAEQKLAAYQVGQIARLREQGVGLAKQGREAKAARRAQASKA
jgi:hypothetical protein